MICHCDAVRLGRSADPLDVVGVVGRECELDEAPVRRVDDAELIAAIGRGEHAVVALGQAELAVELLRRVDVGHAECHVGKTVQGHLATPICKPDRTVHRDRIVLPLDLRHVKKISILRVIPESA